jgi:hypothetical protein
MLTERCMTKAKKIIEMLDQTVSPVDIAQKLKVSRAYVYGVNARLKKQRANKPAPTPKTFWQKVGDWFKNL